MWRGRISVVGKIPEGVDSVGIDRCDTACGLVQVELKTRSIRSASRCSARVLLAICLRLVPGHLLQPPLLLEMEMMTSKTIK